MGRKQGRIGNCDVEYLRQTLSKETFKSEERNIALGAVPRAITKAHGGGDH